MKTSLAILLAILALTGTNAQAQYRGVVWSEPPDARAAAADLDAMAGHGINAVRTAPIQNAGLFDLADSLGIALFQELPISFVPAAHLADTLEAVSSMLQDVISRSEDHTSARHFGLLYGSGTDQPAACTFLRRLVARHGRPGRTFYYVSLFPSADKCRESVQLILLDATDHGRPFDLIRGGDAGLAAVGVPVLPDVPYGLLVPGSAARQARFFEDVLGGLSDRTVFVYRWRDARGFQEATLERSYGLFDASGVPRPAVDVVHGAFTGGQAIFPYPAGMPPKVGRSWVVVFGWIMLLVVAALFALSPRFGAMVPRYFMSHGFYRSAVLEGREGLIVANSLLLAVVGGTVGLMSTLAVEQVVETAPYAAIRHWAGDGAVVALDHVALTPGLPLVIGGGVVIIALSLWVALWTLAVRRRKPLRAGQAMTLAVFPRWTALPLLIAAMVISTIEQADAAVPVLVLVICWFLSAVWGAFRTGIDLMRMMRAGPLAILALWLFNPMFLLVAAAAAALLFKRPEVSLLWSLAVGG